MLLHRRHSTCVSVAVYVARASPDESVRKKFLHPDPSTHVQESERVPKNPTSRTVRCFSGFLELSDDIMVTQSMTRHNKKTCPECQAHATDFKTSLKLAWKMLRGDDEGYQWQRPTAALQNPGRIKARFDRRLTERDEHVRLRLGPLLADLESGRFVEFPRTPDTGPRWSFLCTLFDCLDRAYCAPPRIHVNTPWGHLLIAIGPNGTVARHKDPNKSTWFSFRMRDSLRCETVVLLGKERGGETVFSRYSEFYHCSRRKGHKGKHHHPWNGTPLDRPAISSFPSVDK